MCAFANGLKNDLNTVINAFLYDYNNGIAEGSVNKVKVIKRVMYGRCSFALSKIRLLLLKLLVHSNNFGKNLFDSYLRMASSNKHTVERMPAPYSDCARLIKT